MLNKLRCNAHFWFSASQIYWFRFFIQIHILNDKLCRSRSVGFWRNQLIWIYTVCKSCVYLGPAGQGLRCPNTKGQYGTFRHVPPVMTEISLCCHPHNLIRMLPSTQSDQSLHCLHEETLHPRLSKRPQLKILIPTCECAGWFESSLGTHVRRYIFWHCSLHDYDTALGFHIRCLFIHPTLIYTSL